MQDDKAMHDLHKALDAQSRLVVHPLMGLYIAFPLSTKIPVLNWKWTQLMGMRNFLWDFVLNYVQVSMKEQVTK